MKKNLAATYSPTLLRAVPSAMKGLTSEVGMGSGISPSLKLPEKNSVNQISLSESLHQIDTRTVQKHDD